MTQASCFIHFIFFLSYSSSTQLHASFSSMLNKSWFRDFHPFFFLLMILYFWFTFHVCVFVQLNQVVDVLVPSGHAENHASYISHLAEGGKSVLTTTLRNSLMCTWLYWCQQFVQLNRFSRACSGKEVRALCRDGSLRDILLQVSPVEVGDSVMFVAHIKGLA